MTPGRHQVRHHAHHEEVPGPSAEDQRRIDARVATGDDQNVRLLALRQAGHERAIRIVLGLAEGAGGAEEHGQAVSTKLSHTSYSLHSAADLGTDSNKPET